MDEYIILTPPKLFTPFAEARIAPYPTPTGYTKPVGLSMYPFVHFGTHSSNPWLMSVLRSWIYNGGHY